MSEIYKRIKRGNDLLINVTMTPKDELHLKDVQWEIKFYTVEKGYELTMRKIEAVMVDDDNYICAISTDKFEAGVLKATLKTRIASTYFDDGYQDETTDFVVDRIILY